jgi:hypothetical protein
MAFQRATKWGTLAVIMAFMFSVSAWAASVSSTPQNVFLNATQPEAITISLTGGSTVNFDLGTGGMVAGDATPAWTTYWALNSTNHSNVVNYVYFSGTSALTGTGTSSNIIPTSNFYGNPDGSGSYTPITGTVQSQANALQVSQTAITSANALGNKADTLPLKIDATTPYPVDNYQGTLYVVSVAP